MQQESQPGKKKLTDSKLFGIGISILVGIIVYLIPTPEALQENPRTWRLFAVFVATIVALIANPAPMGTIVLISLTFLVITRTLPLAVALSGFSNTVIWLIACAFFISRGFIKTGLGERIAFLFMAKLGKKTLGLAYSLIFAEGVMALTMPSNTARSGGIIFPIVRSLTDAFGSKVEDGTRKKMGSFLYYTVMQVGIVLCAMFMTGMASNMITVGFAADQGIEITYMIWLVAAIVPGLISILVLPYVIYKIYPPEIKETPEAAEIAKKHLEKMGPMTLKEKQMIFVFILLVTMWIFGPNFGIAATTTAFVGLSVMFITNILDFNDVISEKGAWDAFIWFAVLIMMAGQLNALGFIPWFSQTAGGAVAGLGWIAAFAIIVLVYFYAHYFFASATAHITAMMPGFLAIALVVGTPPMLAALVLGFSSALCMGLTHYGTGPSPIYFAPGYIKQSEWWGYALLLSVIMIVIWFGIGGFWWRIIGLW